MEILHMINVHGNMMKERQHISLVVDGFLMERLLIECYIPTVTLS